MNSYLEALATAIGAKLPPKLLDQPGADQLLLLYALLGMTKGRHVTREDVHDAWVVWRLLLGDAHESMVPFEQLPADVQEEDEPYRRAILAAVDDWPDGQTRFGRSQDGAPGS